MGVSIHSDDVKVIGYARAKLDIGQHPGRHNYMSNGFVRRSTQDSVKGREKRWDGGDDDGQHGDRYG